MVQGHIRNIATAGLCATILLFASLSVRAQEGASEKSSKDAAGQLNLAGLAAVLRAASERKQSGDEVTLKRDVQLRGRPTAEKMQGEILRAGTVVRKSKRQVVNASGTWRHIETRGGLDGWLSEFDFDPE